MLCLFLNQVGAAAGGGTSSGATVVGLGALGDTVGTTLAGSQVTVNGGETTVVELPGTNPPGTNPSGLNPLGIDTPVVEVPANGGSASGTGETRNSSASTGNGLPNTSGVALGVLGLGVLLLGGGAALVAGSRRRRSA